jgi:hypothetical protein
MTAIKLQHGQQVQIKGTRSYHQDARVFTLKGYYDENDRPLPADWDAYVKREKQIGGFEFGFTLAGSMMTSDRAYNLEQAAKRDASPHLATGDTVEVEGQLFTIVNQYNNNFGLEPVQA